MPPPPLVGVRLEGLSKPSTARLDMAKPSRQAPGRGPAALSLALAVLLAASSVVDGEHTPFPPAPASARHPPPLPAPDAAPPAGSP